MAANAQLAFPGPPSQRSHPSLTPHSAPLIYPPLHLPPPPLTYSNIHPTGYAAAAAHAYEPDVHLGGAGLAAATDRGTPRSLPNSTDRRAPCTAMAMAMVGTDDDVGLVRGGDNSDGDGELCDVVVLLRTVLI